MASVGLLGGTFDPVHHGHLSAARQCRELLGLDEVRLVPSHHPPHRPRPEAGPADRLAMARLAAASATGLGVDDIEVRRGGVSYAVETLRGLRKREPRNDFVLLLGQDAAADFGSWRDPAEIGRLARVAVFNRAGREPMSPAGRRDAGLPTATTFLEVDSPLVSATEVRRRLAAGANPEEMLVASVLDYIRERGLYGLGNSRDPKPAVIIGPQ